MLAAFNELIDHWKLICPHVAMLSIKMVAHYGAIAEFKVDRILMYRMPFGFLQKVC